MVGRIGRGLDPEFLLTEEVIAARMEAITSFGLYLLELLAERRANPGDDLLSQLALAEEEGDTLSEEELISTAILLLVAGHETTVNLIAGGVLSLVQHPVQLERLRSDRASCAAASRRCCATSHRSSSPGARSSSR